MNTTLEEILLKKRESVAQLKEKLSLRDIIAQCSEEAYPPSFLQAVHRPGKCSIIAELKKASPSAGVLCKTYDPVQIARVYENGGACALSVLTEEEFFLGSVQDLIAVRRGSHLPILRKDFIVDPYQIYESKVIGASAILLIVAALPESLYLELAFLAKKLDLDVLTEVHDESELKTALKGDPKMIGINNRNLKDLSVNLETTLKLFNKVPKSIPVISESGIKSPETIKELKRIGVSTALIGESLLKSEDPSSLLKSFVQAGL